MEDDNNKNNKLTSASETIPKFLEIHDRTIPPSNPDSLTQQELADLEKIKAETDGIKSLTRLRIIYSIVVLVYVGVLLLVISSIVIWQGREPSAARLSNSVLIAYIGASSFTSVLGVLGKGIFSK